MARVKLVLPENFDFSTQLDIRNTDINYGQHLGSDSVLGMINEARIRLLADKGFSEGDIDGVGIIMLDSVINYVAEGHYGDKLRVDVVVDDITDAGCDIYYRFVNMATDKVIVKAKTYILFFDYANRKKVKTPEKFKTAFGKV